MSLTEQLLAAERAVANGDGQAYWEWLVDDAAEMTSVHVQQHGEWRMALHQQTSLDCDLGATGGAHGTDCAGTAREVDDRLALER